MNPTTFRVSTPEMKFMFIAIKFQPPFTVPVIHFRKLDIAAVLTARAFRVVDRLLRLTGCPIEPSSVPNLLRRFADTLPNFTIKHVLYLVVDEVLDELRPVEMVAASVQILRLRERIRGLMAPDLPFTVAPIEQVLGTFASALFR